MIQGGAAADRPITAAPRCASYGALMSPIADGRLKAGSQAARQMVMMMDSLAGNQAPPLPPGTSRAGRPLVLRAEFNWLGAPTR